MREGEPGWLASLLGATVLIAGGFALGLVAGVVSEEPELVAGHLAGRSEEVAWLPEAEVEFTAESVGLHSSPLDEPEIARGSLADSGAAEQLPAEGLALAQVSVLGDVAPAFDPLDFEPQALEPRSFEPDSPKGRSFEAGAFEPGAAAPKLLERPRPAPTVVEPPLPAVAAAPPSRRTSRAVDSLPRAGAMASSAEGFAVQVGAFSEGDPARDVREKLRSKGFDTYVIPASVSGDGKWRVRVGPVATKAAAEALASRLKSEERLPTWVLAEGGS